MKHLFELLIVIGLASQVQAEINGENLLRGKNPHCFKNDIRLFDTDAKNLFSKDTHTKDGSGSLRFHGKGSEFASLRVRTPTFHLKEGKHYVMRVYVKMEGVAAGQNVMLKVSKKDDWSTYREALFNVSETGEWEEVLLPYIASQTGDYLFQVFFYRYLITTDGQFLAKDASNLGACPDIYFDDFSVVETDRTIVSREPRTSKSPFDGEHVRIDKLGNWSVKEDGQWENIFPRFTYQTWHGDFSESVARMKEYGFTGFVNIDSLGKLKVALDAGLKYNGVQVNNLSPVKPFIQDAVRQMDRGEIPPTAFVMYSYDNEALALGRWQEKVDTARWLNEHDPGRIQGHRARPVYMLNGVSEGLARNNRSSHNGLMDVTGSYVTNHGETTDPRHNPINTLEWLRNTPQQTAPVSLMQMQSYYHNTFVPCLFKGIIDGARGLVFWRGGTTHNGSRNDFRENVWAPAVKGKDGVFARIDRILPLIRQPLTSAWKATLPFVTSTVVLGERDHGQKHYLIMANFADVDQQVNISLNGIQPTEVMDVFTGKEVAQVENGTFIVRIGHFNDGYLVLELK